MGVKEGTENIKDEVRRTNGVSTRNFTRNHGRMQIRNPYKGGENLYVGGDGSHHRIDIKYKYSK